MVSLAIDVSRSLVINMKRRFIPKKVIDAALESAAYKDPAPGILALEQSLNERYINAAGVAYSLKEVAWPECIDGTVRALQGDPAGWPAIHRWFLCTIWKDHVQCVRFDNARVPKNAPCPQYLPLAAEIAYLTAYALSAGWTRIIESFGERLLRNSREPHEWREDGDWTFADGLAAYVVRLYSLWKGDSAEVGEHAACAPGPYQRLFAAWNDPQELTPVLEAMCELHCRQYFRDSGVLAYFPLSIIPAEIVALRKVREKLGLETPVIKHPLLDSPFAAIPENPVSTADDEQFQTVITLCKRSMPNLKEPW